MEKKKLSQLINPQLKQYEALKALFNPLYKYILYGGAMGGGKSYILRWGALSYALWLYLRTGIRNIPVGLFSEDYPTLKDRQISRIEREFPKDLGELKDTKVDGLAFQISPEYGSGKILLRNLDDPSKYMSTEFAGEFVEELTRNNEQTFMDLRNRLRYPGVDEVKFMGATNPGGIGHGWVKKLFITRNTQDREQNRFFYVHANAYDNKFISPEYIKQLESLPEQQRKAYLEGSWDVFAGQYFDMWMPNLHVIRPFVPSSNELVVGGMDWGRAKPFSFHLATVGKEYVRNEFGDINWFYRTKTFLEVYGTNRTPEEWSKRIKEELKVYKLSLNDISWVQADPTIFNKGNDGSMSIYDQFIKEDDRWRILQPARNDRIPGWVYMVHWLSTAPDGRPYWQVTENCTNLIRTLPELIHDENDVEDVDTEGEDHAADDQRYMLRNLKLIEGITGQIRSKTEIVGRHEGKFYGSNEDVGQLLIDVDLFTK